MLNCNENVSGSCNLNPVVRPIIITICFMMLNEIKKLVLGLIFQKINSDFENYTHSWSSSY